MSEVVPHKKSIDRRCRLREYKASPVTLDFDGGAQPVTVRLADDQRGRATCLGCHDSPCMTLSLTDFTLPEPLSDFPGDPAREICPTRAINWDDAGEVAVIDETSCIGCGLCVSRCPYGAIFLTQGGFAKVEGTDPDTLTTSCEGADDRSEHDRITRIGRIGSSSSAVMHNMPEAVSRLADLHATQFIRNLLIACGVSCRTRRRGDTNVRMDGVIALASGRVGVLEIELVNAVLESPRALLEDIAILHGRYGIAPDIIDPVSVVLRLPNARSEYFQFIDDIENVLHIHCRTISVGALASIMWSFKKIDDFPGTLFRTSSTGTDLLPAMKTFFGNDLPSLEPYAGAYRPLK